MPPSADAHGHHQGLNQGSQKMGEVEPIPAVTKQFKYAIFILFSLRCHKWFILYAFVYISKAVIH